MLASFAPNFNVVKRDGSGIHHPSTMVSTYGAGRDTEYRGHYSSPGRDTSVQYASPAASIDALTQGIWATLLLGQPF